ncbi:MAG: hypothetical protein A2527_08875 [Candidatus Lambdaproteobacteria bacterium RIFOXYD2_FULL_50_16]|uniref:Flagellar protein FlgJ N-terminal domain-containing protein n=1 Tax=Candidatus Lambdaproteobacteria bacterium RIFOXYD2_FULL_50_16 TaxID=1817772 RepID=A0A1F6GAY4_9PROT|nr:MAG: hypothetical protein A2527_08875 [Candidatus Lambdaproteobacteria bacterium RIFOXYD2_FULL_50_16]
MDQLAKLVKKGEMEQGEKTKFNQELKEASDGFEEIMVKKMITSMRANTFKVGMIDGGPGEEIFQDMLDDNYSKLIVSSGSLGLSDLLYQQNKK